MPHSVLKLLLRERSFRSVDPADKIDVILIGISQRARDGPQKKRAVRRNGRIEIGQRGFRAVEPAAQRFIALPGFFELAGRDIQRSCDGFKNIIVRPGQPLVVNSHQGTLWQGVNSSAGVPKKWGCRIGFWARASAKARSLRLLIRRVSSSE